VERIEIEYTTTVDETKFWPGCGRKRKNRDSNMAEQQPHHLPGVGEVEVEVETMLEPQQEIQIETQPMIALQPLAEPEREEVVVQTSEEVIDESRQHEALDISPPRNKRKGRPGRYKGAGKHSRLQGTRGRVAKRDEEDGDLDQKGTRKWEQRQVQVKTLEGEFSVVMWASGT
jgi:transcription factor YY